MVKQYIHHAWGIMAVLGFVFLAFASPAAHAQLTETILHTFNAYADGVNPSASLIQGKDGAYYGTTEFGGTNGFGTIFKIDSTGLTTIHSFTGPDGTTPLGKLVQGSDGKLYGTTFFSGSGYGTVYKVNLDGTSFTVLYTFNYSSDGGYPERVILASDGKLYGTTASGGAYDWGTVFQLSTDGTTFNVLHSFNLSSDGGAPYAGVFQANDGKLYGTTFFGGSYGAGAVYKVNLDGTGFTVLHAFNGADGASPSSDVIQASDGMLYGACQGGGAYGFGTVFQLSTDGITFNVLHSFNYSNGGYPEGGVIQANDGKLYGTTENGGPNRVGTVYELSTDGTTFNSLHSFNPSTEGYEPHAGVIQGSDGLLHGATYYGPDTLPRDIGTLFTLDTAGTSFTTVFKFNDGFVDGICPNYGRLALGKDGNFYGTTQYGGVNSNGTLYKISPTGKITTLHLFTNSTGEGSQPLGGITIDKRGNIFGTTTKGGSFDGGTVFAFMPATNTFATLYNFGGPLGSYLPSDVVVNGTKLAGTTFSGGQFNQGIVYQINLPTATNPLMFHILHSFSGPEGANPWGTLILGSDRTYYGTTQYGGAYNYGVVYKIMPTGVYTVLHNFNWSDGANPYAGLLQGSDGMLYSATWYGGTSGDGTVFQISKDGSVFHVLHNFSYTDGGFLAGTLMQASDGLLYGTTARGGTIGAGTVFKLSTDGSVFRSLYSFSSSGSDGYYPLAGLTEGTDGNLYGTANGGGINPGYQTNINGTVYRLNAQLPLIQSFWPASGSVSVVTIVTLRGVNLTGATVTIAGVNQTAQAGATATALKFKLNAATPMGSYPIVVTTANGTGTCARKFTVNP